MNDAFSAILQDAAAWAARAQAAGWVPEGEVQQLLSLEQATPGDLFVNTQMRPLVVAFFGGTGVGKSSLLNRLAAKPIARTGVERPTSHEVTLYVHESIALAKLPEEFPIGSVKVKTHENGRRREVMWVDMPDIDSAVQANRELALAWLPHVDLLIYVVSPERYRDDTGWQLLKVRKHRHAWLFVINHWDEGHATQADDFAATLRGAGFDDPLVLRTSCAQEGAGEVLDDFGRLEEVIQEVLRSHGVREFERLGHSAKLRDLETALSATLRHFGESAAWAEVREHLQASWSQTQEEILQGMSWSVQACAARLGRRDKSLLGTSLQSLTGLALRLVKAEQSATPTQSTTPAQGVDLTEADTTDQELARAGASLWDPWAQGRVNDVLDLIEIELGRSGTSTSPVRVRLESVANSAKALVDMRVQAELRRALARPGTRLQRTLRRATGVAKAALPILALLWVGYEVVTGFFQASTGQGDYLGTNFAVNSVLLVLVSWLLPAIFHRALRPSLEATAARALDTGLTAGFSALEARMLDGFDQAASERAALLEQAARIVGEVEAWSPLTRFEKDEPLQKLLARPASEPV